MPTPSRWTPWRAINDADRPLTEKGLQQCKALAETLKRGGVVLGKVVTSPYLRRAPDGRGSPETLAGASCRKWSSATTWSPTARRRN